MLESALAGVATLAVVVIGLVVRALLAVLVIGALLVPLALLVLGWAWGGRLVDRLAGLQRLGHVRWRRGCYYTPGHLWLRPRPPGPSASGSTTSPTACCPTSPRSGCRCRASGSTPVTSRSGRSTVPPVW
jgi:hypothetical protein